MGRKISTILLFATVILAYFYGIQYLPFRGEEANRFLTAYEMFKLHSWFNPTHLGEPYYLKPPLFMDLEILAAKLLGWHEWTGRVISVISVFLTALLVYLWSLKLFKSRRLATLSALILLTLGDIAVFYGFVAEIDAFHMLVYFAAVYGFYTFLEKGRLNLAFATAGFLTAVSFLTKGFPAFYHIPLSVLLILLFKKRLRLVISRYTVVGLVALILPLAVWYVSLSHPHDYIKALWGETFSRVRQTDKLADTLKHLLLFLLLNFKQLLPYSALALFLLIKERSRFAGILKDGELSLILALTVVNYLPYLVSPEGRGRYILIVFPFLAILFTFLLEKLLEKKLNNLWVKIVPIVLLLIAFIPYAWNFKFFTHYGVWQMFLAIGVLMLSAVLLFRKEVSLLTALVISVLAFKIGFVNYGAPHKERKNPAREIAANLSPAYPRGAVIRYLPPDIYMELCAYTDLYTEGLVLRKDGKFILTDKKHLPRSGVEILKEYKGWIAAKYRNR